MQEISAATGISSMSVHRILKDMDCRKLACKFIPKVLNQHQKDERVRLSTANLRLIQRDATVLDRIVTMDESWVFCFDPHTKQADMQWLGRGEARPKKALRACSQKKCMLVLFFDARGVIFMEFLQRNERMNSELYIAILHQFREAFRRKHPDLWRNEWFYHQDNAPCHVSLDMYDYFHSVSMAENIWPHPAYSPDLAPCDFWAFPVLKKQIRGHRFADLEEVQDTVCTLFRRTPAAEYQNVFNTLGRRYQKCISSGGDYFE